jgi:acetyl esterase/lipase
MRLKVLYHCIRSGAGGLLVASLLLAACSSPSSPTPTAAPAATPSPTAEAATLTTEITKNIHYADVDERGTNLDVYAPSDPGTWPVVIVVHGGGQVRSSFAPLAEAIASQGAVVYNIDTMFTFPWSSIIERIACAVRFARATAADYGGDPGRITLVGSSAGAATGAVVALAGDDFEGDCVVTDASALPDALVAFEGPYDYATTAYHYSHDHTILKDQDPELWEAINPYSHIGRNPDLQVRLVHGDDIDLTVYDTLPQVSIEFRQALADAGYDVELIVVEGASHETLHNKYLNPDGFALTVQQVMELARSSSQ